MRVSIEKKLTELTLALNLRELWKYEGSPCFKCIVRTTCNKLVSDKTACNEYKLFIWNLVEKVRKEQEE